MGTAVGRIVIVGAGQAGGRAAEALRAAGYTGAVTLLGAERHHPYERPQLSKQLLSDRTSQVAYLRPQNGWREALNVDVMTGCAVVDGCATRRVVAMLDGREFAYDRLLLATGTRPRRLPALEGTTARVQYLRNVEDALELRERLHDKARVVIVGGGVIGLEAACAAAKLGCDVTVVESQSRLLARAFPKLVSEFIAGRHRAHGVRFAFDVTVEAGIPGGVRLNDREELAADVVLVGIGVEPCVSVAEAMGLRTSDGIRVDAFGRTDDENISCAGDVAVQWSTCHQRPMRIETWANAQNQAAATAANMVGMLRAYGDPVWFWTDQYDLNVQVVGDPTRGDQVVRGDPANGKFSVIALLDGNVAGAVSINSAKDMALLRRIAGQPIRVDRSDIEAATFDLRRLLKAA